ncbi:MAG: DNA repair protein RecO [Candidatus Kerfeldbacteria bacterium]|nr:DNA repair protein RecO [Candidatus Kerfeldbacteria bacterium]
MAATFQTNAIVLKRKDFREKDRLVTFFTEEYGKIQAQAISVKKFHSKLAGHLEPFLHTRIMIANGRRIDKIAGSVTIHAFRHLRTSAIGVTLASHLVEMIDVFTRDHVSDPFTFALLRDTLAAYDTLLTEEPKSRRKLTLLFDRFLLHFVGAQGFRLHPNRCSTCGEQLGEEATFSPSNGMMCTRHPTTFDATPMLARDREILERIESASPAGSLAIPLEEDEHRKLHRWLTSFVTYHFERRLRTEPFVRRVFV